MAIDPTNFGQLRAQATLPSSNADPDTGMEPTQSADTGKQLTPPTQAPSQQPMQLQPSQPSVTTPAVPPTSNPRLQGFIHSVLSGTLSALAGKAPTAYETGADGRVVPAKVQPTDTLANKGRRLASHALEGLAAGSAVPQQRYGSKASALASGLGAGASAATLSANAADAKARQQERENEDAKQRKILNDATRAHLTANTYALYQHAIQEGLDHDPQRAIYQSIFDAASDPESGMKAQIMSEDEARSFAKNNPGWTATHYPVPLGSKPLMENGQPVINADGSPKMVGQVGIITHPETTGQGTFVIPAPMADEVNKFGKHAGITEEVKAGQEIDPFHFAALYGKVQAAKKEAAGAKHELVTVADENATEGEDFGVAKGRKLQRRNPISGDYSDPDATELQNYRKGQADLGNKQDKGGVTDALRFVQDREDARAKLKLKQEQEAGKQTDAFGNTSPLSEKEFNKRYDAFNKSKQYQTLQTLQGSYQQFQQVINDLNAGKDLTGAASVVALFNAIGISATPLAGKGFRINENTIKEHVDARGVDQAAYQKLLSLKTGATITPQQIRDYAGIATGVYRDTYLNTANEEKRQLGYIDVLPLGNNTPIDPITARLYLTIAGNNPDLATEAAKKNGWVVPSVKGTK
jgi:hypothetical protein